MPDWAAPEPAREAVDAMPGRVLLEFGAPWCGHCLAAEPHVARALQRHPEVRHIRVEDGRGRPLGRSFRVRLWPTLVLVENGIERSRSVRPRSLEDVEALFDGTAGTA